MTTAQEWSGGVGEAWASSWSLTDRSFADLSTTLDAAILAELPSDAKCAVDLGCGAGVTSLALATARPDLSVAGVDVSADLIRIARERGEGIANLTFHVADLNRDASAAVRGADLLCSRHGVMFFDDPTAVFAALRSGAAPGARFVFSCFRSASLNTWASALVARITGKPPISPLGYAPGPFAFADPAFVTAMLAAAGWRAARPEPVDYVYVAGAGADPLAAALGFFSRIGPVAGALKAAPETTRAALLDNLATVLAAHRDGARISFPAAAWIWRATAMELPQ